MIERVTRVPLREVWRHEAHDFTIWLCNKIDILGEIIGIELSNPENEKSTGNFKVDLLAEVENGDTMIIENRLGKSDHDHLDKLVTNLSALEAEKAICIVREPQTEHIQAINWLNEAGTVCDFFLVKIGGVKIGDFLLAPLTILIVRPSEESKEVGKIKKEDSERHKLRLKFWTLLLEKPKARYNLFNGISPSKDPWIGTGVVKRGITNVFWGNRHGVKV